MILARREIQGLAQQVILVLRVQRVTRVRKETREARETQGFKEIPGPELREIRGLPAYKATQGHRATLVRRAQLEIPGPQVHRAIPAQVGAKAIRACKAILAQARKATPGQPVQLVTPVRKGIPEREYRVIQVLRAALV